MNYQKELEAKGSNIGWATLISETLLLLIMGFREYRDFSLFALHEKQNFTFPGNNDINAYIVLEKPVPNGATANQKRPIGFYKNQPHDYREGVSNDYRTITHDNREGKNPHLRSCIECNQEYAYKHVKQKFCSDSCRTKHHKNKRKK